MSRTALLGSLLAVTLLVGCGGTTKTVIVQTHTVTVSSSSSGSSSTTSTTAPVTSQGTAPNPIFFYADPAVTARPEVRPAQVTFSADGNNWMTRMRWHGWGGAVAVATGIDHVNDCLPNCAQGRITPVPAEASLYRPGRSLGRRMYLCYRVAFTAPSPIRGFGFCTRADPPIPAKPVTKCGAHTFACPVEVDCPIASDGTASTTGCYGVVGITGYVPAPRPGFDRTGLGLSCAWSRAHLTADHIAYAYICDPRA